MGTLQIVLLCVAGACVLVALFVVLHFVTPASGPLYDPPPPPLPDDGTDPDDDEIGTG